MKTSQRKRISILVFLLAIIVLFIWKNPTREFVYNEGLIFGTNYHIIYESPQGEDYGTALRQHLLNTVDNSLSTFNKNSVISKINTNQEHRTDTAFETVFLKAQEISKITNGAFDMTVAPLVNRWGFGYGDKKDSLPTTEEIEDLLQNVGYQKIKLEQHQIIKEKPEIKLDASAIAKGFSVDVAAEFLQEKGISNYMVEIGGEVRVKGNNKSGKKWRLGIDRPIEDITASNRKLDTILYFNDMSLATSGNYRQFYYKNGKRYSHTINPISGYPVNHTLLSATVLAPDCMTADAFATACMVMGTEKSLKLAQKLNHIEIYLIVDDNGTIKDVYSSGLEKYFQP